MLCIPEAGEYIKYKGDWYEVERVSLVFNSSLSNNPENKPTTTVPISYQVDVKTVDEGKVVPSNLIEGVANLKNPEYEVYSGIPAEADEDGKIPEFIGEYAQQLPHPFDDGNEDHPVESLEKVTGTTFDVKDYGENESSVNQEILRELNKRKEAKEPEGTYFRGYRASDSVLKSYHVGSKIDVLGWQKGLSPLPDNSKLAPIVAHLLAIQYYKELDYGSSWKGKGEYRGIMANIDRKYDRLDKITNDELNGVRKGFMKQEEMLERDYDLYSEEVGESKLDAIADLANYTLLYMSYVQENFPLVFKVWREQNISKDVLELLPAI